MNNYEIYSAGILPYTFYKDNIYFLLGRDSDNRWSDFGGRVEPKDRGEHETTAAREFFEETLGAVYDYEYMRKYLKSKKNKKLISRTNSGHNYYMYIIYINYNEIYRTKFQSTRNFIANTVTTIDKKYLEKKDIRWVSIDTLEHSFNGNSFINLRSVFLNTFKNFKTEIDNYVKNKNTQ